MEGSYLFCFLNQARNYILTDPSEKTFNMKCNTKSYSSENLVPD